MASSVDDVDSIRVSTKCGLKLPRFFRDQKFTGWAKEVHDWKRKLFFCEEISACWCFNMFKISTVKQRVHKSFEAQYYYKLCVDCEWDTINTYAITHVRQPLCSSKLKSPEWKAVKRCVNFACACVCVCVGNVAMGCNRKFLKRCLQKPICFFFQWSRCLFAVPQFDHFDHILRQFRPWADPLDFTMILPWIFRPTFSSCSQKMNGSLYSPVTRWK